MVTPKMQQKLKPWIVRELTAILGMNDVDILVELVLSLLRKYDSRSEQTKGGLEDFLHGNVEIFLHELACFAISSHQDVVSYDKYVRYDKSV